jgi:hypothetical protein
MRVTVDLQAPWSFHGSQSVRQGDRLVIVGRFYHRRMGTERRVRFYVRWNLESAQDPHFLGIAAILNSHRDPAEFADQLVA